MANVIDQLLDERAWLMADVRSRIDRIAFSTPSLDFRQLKATDANPENGCVFFVIRDDLLHPTVGGNKMRKLDALVPYLKQRGVTDILTCGGCQSAHASAVAVVCAEHGMTSHLLLRGEKLATPTGYNLISKMYGNVTSVLRSEYADRKSMFEKHAIRIAGAQGAILWSHGYDQVAEGDNPDRKIVAVVEEGASNYLALLGLIRLVKFIHSEQIFGAHERLKIVVDSGTGTTAIGLAIGAAILGLEWEVVGVMLADTREYYESRKQQLLSEFLSQFHVTTKSLDHLPLVWCEREHQRRFGNVLKGELGICKKIARQTGILLDPIYTLAAWEKCLQLSLEGNRNSKVVMLHTGGTLGLFGLAQRYAGEF